MSVLHTQFKAIVEGCTLLYLTIFLNASRPTSRRLFRRGICGGRFGGAKFGAKDLGKEAKGLERQWLSLGGPLHNQ